MISSQGLGKAALAHPCARSISAWPRPASRPAGLTFSLHVTAPAHPCARGISASLHVADVRHWKAPESEAKVEVT